MSAKLLKALLCIAVAGLFYVPTASAGVFQLVEINSTQLEERLSNDSGNDEDENSGDEGDASGDRTIEGSEPQGHSGIFSILFQLMGFTS